MPGVAATVYDDQITIRELAEECIARHGKEVLEGTINRTLIELECKKQGITVDGRRDRPGNRADGPGRRQGQERRLARRESLARR